MLCPSGTCHLCAMSCGEVTASAGWDGGSQTPNRVARLGLGLLSGHGAHAHPECPCCSPAVSQGEGMRGLGQRRFGQPPSLITWGQQIAPDTRDTGAINQVPKKLHLVPSFSRESALTPELPAYVSGGLLLPELCAQPEGMGLVQQRALQSRFISAKAEHQQCREPNGQA